MNDFSSLQELHAFCVLGPMRPAAETPLEGVEIYRHGVDITANIPESGSISDLLGRFRRTFAPDAAASDGGDQIFFVFGC